MYHSSTTRYRYSKRSPNSLSRYSECEDDKRTSTIEVIWRKQASERIVALQSQHTGTWIESYWKERKRYGVRERSPELLEMRIDARRGNLRSASRTSLSPRPSTRIFSWVRYTSRYFCQPASISAKLYDSGPHMR